MCIQNVGIGLRNQHIQEIIETKPQIPWLEVHSENFFTCSPEYNYLQTLSTQYPLSFHGVGLSIGSIDKLNTKHLQKLKKIIEIFKPELVSDHLSWNSFNQHYYHDLYPLPYTQESLALIVDKIKAIQDYLQQQILIENPSSYLSFTTSTIPEWEFFASLPALCDCKLLLDVNNVYVSSKNHNFDSITYIDNIQADSVCEIHLAGHNVKTYQNKQIFIDDHGSKISEEVWDLYTYTINKMGNKPTLIEWDSNIPALDVLIGEAHKAQGILDACN